MEIIDILQLLVPNVWTAISQLCASAVLFFLMYKLAYKPVKNILDKRSDFEQAKLDEANSLKEETEKLNKEAKDMISSANKTAETIVKEAKEEGEEIKQELIEEGKQQTKQMMENAQRDIAQQKDKMYEEMHDEMVKATISAAEKLLETKLDGKKEKDNIDSFIKEVINS